MLLFDTTFLIDLISGDERAISFARKLDREPSYISVISLHEYLFGIYFKYGKDNQALSKKLLLAEQAFSAFKVLPLSKSIIEISSKVQANLAREGKTIGIDDIYIAATALRYNLAIITRNKAHFGMVRGLRLESY